MSDILKHKNWTKWKSFPDPRKQEYLFAPFGLGVYQLRNLKDKEFQFTLFGKGNHLSERMTTLLPKGLGRGTRNNSNKRNYVSDNIASMEYRTIPFDSRENMKQFEDKLKALNIHRFNT